MLTMSNSAIKKKKLYLYIVLAKYYLCDRELNILVT